MNELTDIQLLDRCSEAFKSVRTSLYEACAYLYQIEQNGAWEGKYSSFSEYVEQECQISRGQASKLLTVWRYFVIERGVSQAKLEKIDAEKLYLATKLPQETFSGVRSPDDLLTIAREWSRQDFRDELASHEGVDCGHPEGKRIVLCGICSKRVG
jgi:hypothetical protein